MKKICLFIMMTVSVLLIQNCSVDSDINEIETSEFETYLSIDKSDFNLARDWESLSEKDKAAFNLAQKRMNFTFDKNGICGTKWTSGSQVNMSDELFEYFISMIDFTNEVTKDLKKMSEMQLVKPPRLKSGGESGRSNNCVVQSLYYILSSLGAPYSLSDIDNWVYDNNYYSYDETDGWGASTGILSHYLSGGFLQYASQLPSSSSSSNYILILNGSPLHAVVFTSRNNSTVNYYDPQNGTTGSCNISSIRQIFMATGYFYLW
jgi:hypothetical protein